MEATNQFDALNKYTKIVADTGEISAIKEYKPIDATTNPSLILSAAKLPEYKYLINEACEYGKKEGKTDEDKLSLAFDRLAVGFGVEISKLVPGVVSTEVDARLSFDTEATIAKARSLVKMYKDLGVDPAKKVLIKIASTWEGIQAAKVLEAEGIHVNMTLLFSMCQAIACAEVGATLISPFVGRIMDWYTAKTGTKYVDGKNDPGVESVTKIFNYYKKFGYKTIVMGASFRNKGQIVELAGCDKLTIAPKLLKKLKESKEPIVPKLVPESAAKEQFEKLSIDEKQFRYMLNEDPMGTEKLSEGIRKFGAAAATLESILKEKLGIA
uniref:Transaldolase n=1 Tax=Lotharella globosa TaxID=91324 RepID=A0A7S3YYI6_9EUKA|eukprot:CAMPEP_0167794650 /NCGR_PEP_ID=MMETSP0111_2-20121227/13924_1 /TAXON_ID=91324 /ORGANISM="Lotharella globosa, Strain CCCM811" /LENGTH=325 /DNA_ID=CAMNT_0007688083 /DNA_START=57 /DNA_END=1034 /DNA_ORIENTATION=-